MAEIGRQTTMLEAEAARLEAETASLMGQLAQWYSPAYIDQRSQELGLTREVKPLYVKIQAAPAVESAQAESRPQADTLAQRVIGALPGLRPLGESINLAQASGNR